jgi:hypothetical protein
MKTKTASAEIVMFIFFLLGLLGFGLYLVLGHGPIDSERIGVAFLILITYWCVSGLVLSILLD